MCCAASAALKTALIVITAATLIPANPWHGCDRAFPVWNKITGEINFPTNQKAKRKFQASQK